MRIVLTLDVCLMLVEMGRNECVCAAIRCCLRDYLGKKPSLRFFFFFAKRAEIDLSLAMPTSQNALPQNPQEKPGLQNGQV